MRKKLFFQIALYTIKAPKRLTLLFFSICFIALISFTGKANAQAPVTGMKANGKILNAGDTINVCVGGRISYENLAQNGTIKWQFNLGSPTNGTGTGPFSVFYNTAGIDSTLQTVVSGLDTANMYVIVKVNDKKPTPSFTFTQSDSCGNIPIQFSSNGSSGNPDPLTYKWIFGDGGTDTSANPSYSFLNATGSTGTQPYAVKLIVANSLNCSDSISKTITVKKIPDASLDNPDNSVGFYPYNGVPTFAKCTNIPSYFFQFKNNSATLSINTSYKINWGDSSPDSVFTNWTAATIITHNYTIGQHTLTITVTGSTGCIGIKRYNIFLGTTPAGGFATPGNNDICAPGGLNFIISGYANNTIGTTYTISVNDGTDPITYQHPPPDTITHFFSNTSCGSNSSTYTNSFSATLIIANPCLTTSVDVKPIFVSTKPRAAMGIYPSTYICTNSTISVYNTSTSGNTVSSAGNTTRCSVNGKQVWIITPSTGYTITYGSLGDIKGNATNSNVWENGTSLLNIVFTTPGTYTIKLYAGTDRCGVTEVVKTICVRNPPQASFKMNKKWGCGIDTAVITNTSPVGGCLGDSYNWTVSYSDPSNCNTRTGSDYSFVNGTLSSSTNPNIQFLKAGRYIITLTVSAINTSYTCAPAVFRDTFFVKAKPKVKIGAINAVCIGNTISPTATITNCYGTDPLTYAWTFYNGTPTSSSQLSPGAISYGTIGNQQVVLDVTNECGVSTDTAYANITSTPVANGGKDTSVCSGVPVKIGSSPVAGLSYQWTPASGLSSSTTANPTLTLNYTGPSTDTTYTYIVTASAGSNCSGKDTVLITVKKKPVLTITPLTASVCVGSGAQLVAGGADSYSWTPTSSLNNSTKDTVIASPTINTTYTVVGITNGCSSSATATITVVSFPNVNAGIDTTVCNTSSTVQLTASPAGGTWSGSSFITSSGSFNATSAGNGTYTLIYTTSNGNCSKSDSLVVTVIDPPIANAGNDTTVCQSSVPLQLTGLPAGGRWSGSSLITSSGLFTPSIAGKYTLIYTIGDGTCVGRDTLIMDIAGGITNNIIGTDQSICAGYQTQTIIGQDATGGNGAAVYQWQQSTDNIAWTNITSATLKDFTPPLLTQTTYFRRVASTTLCSGTQASTSNVVKVTINPDAKADFNPTTTKGCVSFIITPSIINLTPNNSVGEYRWYVNGSFIGSNQNFPGYTMNNPGDSITIKLVTISKYGCKNDSLEKGFVTVERPSPSFTLSDTVGCGPLTVSFVNSTPNADRYTFIWNFGQGQTSLLQQPGKVIFLPNPTNADTIYTITLKAISACDTVTSTRFIKVKSKPKALFTPDKSEGCSPMKVTFSNTSRGTNVNYVWNYGDGASIATNDLSVQHTYTVGVKDTFSVRLVGSNECGSDSLSYAIVVNPNSIRIDFAINGKDRFGCAPHTVKFINNTTGANSFKWDFGDGTTVNTTKGVDTIAHTYNTPGNFNAILFATNSCNDTTDTEPVTIQIKPKVSFNAPTITCLADTIHFVNTSDNNISNLWRFGDETTSFVREPAKLYSKAGTYRITLVGTNVYSQGLSCADSATADIVVRDTLPGDFTVSDSISSCLPFTVTFKNANATSLNTTWSFGDGSTAAGDNVTHTFTTRGSFIVKMIGTGGSGCIFYSTKTIQVNSPTGTLNYKSGYSCFGTPSKIEILNGNASQYQFVFGDGDSLTTTNPLVFHPYAKPGTYIPYVYLNEGNCKIKLSLGDTIKVDKVVAGFRRSSQFNCGQTTVQFIDTSSAFYGIASRRWEFGDGTNSSLQNVQKTFNQNGTYYTNLQVTGISGCIDTVTVPIDVVVRNFPASVIGSDSVACTGQAINLAALVQSTDSVSILNWSFGNNTTASGKNVKAIYNTSGMYTVRLITSTIYGCTDTTYKTIQVNASPIVNGGPDVRICKGQSIQLQAFGASTYQWSPLQNLSCSTCANPIANPNLSTQYIVRGSNNQNCSVTDTIVVEVIQPFKLTVSNNDSICIGEQTQLFASGATRYLWNPVAGLSNGTIPNPIANPTTTTQYQVIGGDPYNCFFDTAYVTVAVGNYPTVNLGTGGTFVAGTAQIISPLLTNGPFKSYLWTPATDLSCTNCPRPVVTINKDITYKLEVENIYGCKASDTIIYKATCQEALQVYIPNAFSPDGDGLNDILMVRGKGLATIKYFRIFNRWGQLVFERSNFSANDAQQGWDGKVNGIQANPDVYVFTAEVVCTAGENFVLKGNVTLVR